MRSNMGSMVRRMSRRDSIIGLILKAGGVKRYHTEELIPPQPVSSHTWRLISILMHIWPGSSRDVILAAQYHDIGELVTGDLPAPVKWWDNELALHIRNMERVFTMEVLHLPQLALTASEVARLKCADYLELTDYCSQFDNRDAHGIMLSGVEAVGKYSMGLTKADGHALAEYLRTAQTGWKGQGVRQEVSRIIMDLETRQYAA